MDRKNMDPLIEGYFAYLLDVRRLVPRSIIDMRCTFNRAMNAMNQIRPEVPLWKLTLEDFLQWIDLERNQGWSTNSIDKGLSHIRGLLNYAWRNGRADRNVLDGFYLRDAKNKKPPRVLSLEEASQLIDACSNKTKQQRRDRIMILLLYGCGLRTGELCALNVGDMDRERQEIVVRSGKGDIERRVPVPNAVWTELLAYLLERKGVRGALFRTEVKRTRISSRNVTNLLRDLVKSTGLTSDVKPKTLRHSFATHLMDRGVDISIISSLMGHRSISETGAYLHALPGKTQDAVFKLDSIQEDLQ